MSRQNNSLGCSVKTPTKNVSDYFMKKCQKCLNNYDGSNKKFCSRKCYSIFQCSIPAELHPSWRGGISKHSSGYIKIMNKQHHRAHKNRGYVFQHIEIMEKFLGRKLKKNEEIHHINKNKSDNRIENLMLVTKEDHRKYDRGWWKIDGNWWKKCTKCKKEMEVNLTNFYKRKIGVWESPCKKCCALIYKMKVKTPQNQP